MVFEALYEAAQAGELLLIEGGICHWHHRRDGQVTIREIISTRPGAGSAMLTYLNAIEGATSLLARCPASLESNAWYERRGFVLEATETTKSGRTINVWRLILN
jgi:hypothetical protein